MTTRKFTLGIVFLLAISYSAEAQKKEVSISTYELINASSEEVFEVLRELERFTEWSPFLVEDPNQKNYVSGENGEIGSTFHWEGVEENSKGQQTLAALKEGEYVRMECDLEKPFKGQPIFEYYIQEDENGVELRQEFNLNVSGFSYFMIRLLGVKKKMAETNQVGLARLKSLVEKENSNAQSI